VVPVSFALAAGASALVGESVPPGRAVGVGRCRGDGLGRAFRPAEGCPVAGGGALALRAAPSDGAASSVAAAPLVEGVLPADAGVGDAGDSLGVAGAGVCS
jgi:hypothetical protein